ncbi:MAG: guanylate kinase [Mycoplasmataceae bacterium]|nr:guanylate kinase [Mycoplasmataceae bacterium]
MNKGNLIVLCGPSGAGKGSVEKLFLNDPKYNFYFSISVTSREPRANEVNHQNYHFLTKKDFKEKIKNNDFLEWAKFINNYYGTPIEPIEKNLVAGKNIFLEIEIKGVLQVIKKMPEAITIFLSPPSIDDLRERLYNRNTENNKLIEKRIKQANIELRHQNIFDYVVVNNDVEESAKKIREILDKELNV